MIGEQTVQRYVDRQEMARILGIHPSTLDVMRKQGCPELRWGRRIVRFHPPSVIRWVGDRSGEDE